jgi:hypothetical protein
MFRPDTKSDSYSYNKIELSELYSCWKLKVAVFKCEFGVIENLEDYYEVPDSSKLMEINQTRLNKYLFWREPYYTEGTFTSDQTDSKL